MNSTPSQGKCQSYTNRILFVAQANIIVKFKFTQLVHFFRKVLVVLGFCQNEFAISIILTKLKITSSIGATNATAAINFLLIH